MDGGGYVLLCEGITAVNLMCVGRAWVVCRSCRCNAVMVSGSPSARRTHDRRTCRGRAGMVSGSPSARRTHVRRTCRSRAEMVSGSPSARRTHVRKTIDVAARQAAPRHPTTDPRNGHCRPSEWPLPDPQPAIMPGKIFTTPGKSRPKATKSPILTL